MTPKWTIRKYAVSALGNEVALPWMLFKPGVIPPKTFHEAYWAACSMGETPSEVFAYVESEIRKARTVEVELPEVVREAELISEPYAELIVLDQVDGNVRVTAGDQALYLLDSDLKPLGEYLLALHYEKEQQ